MQAAYSISVVTICFIIYYFTISSGKTSTYLQTKHGLEKAKISTVLFQRLLGVLLFGIAPLALIPFLGISFNEIGLLFSNDEPIILWIIGLSLICSIVNFFAARKPDHLAIYPQIRTPQPWSKNLFFSSALTLFLYTLAYEIMFRGYLLFTCYEELGLELAIVINTSIYALVHIPKGWKETVGSFPMGIVLCLLTIKSGNIWTAVAVHVALAWSSEWFSIYYGIKLKEIGNKAV